MWSRRCFQLLAADPVQKSGTGLLRLHNNAHHTLQQQNTVIIYPNFYLVSQSINLEEQVQVLDVAHPVLLVRVHEGNQHLECWPVGELVLFNSSLLSIAYQAITGTKKDIIKKETSKFYFFLNTGTSVLDPVQS